MLKTYWYYFICIAGSNFFTPCYYWFCFKLTKTRSSSQFSFVFYLYFISAVCFNFQHKTVIMSQYLVPPMLEDKIPNPFQWENCNGWKYYFIVIQCAGNAFSILPTRLIWRTVLLNILLFFIYALKVMFKDGFCVRTLFLIESIAIYSW